eukprot:jgi/Ulvmu1/4418/UM002_0143.1
MTTLRRFCCNDLFTFNAINLDPLTETYHFSFYLEYLAKWPEYCQMAVGSSNDDIAYVLGKVEGEQKLWHGHVTAVTVAPQCRRMGLASKLMNVLEDTTEKMHDGYFVDLFVRKSNESAIALYKRLGYTTYRTVLGYYSGTEDALDMRKAMPRDVNQESTVPLKHPVLPQDIEFD